MSSSGVLFRFRVLIKNNNNENYNYNEQRQVEITIIIWRNRSYLYENNSLTLQRCFRSLIKSLLYFVSGGHFTSTTPIKNLNAW